uniref:Uncharacterized protein n=1 Tax=Rhizophora mucronata TaxID=61149 RepID=A0A2P2P8S3_RHIMU
MLSQRTFAAIFCVQGFPFLFILCTSIMFCLI